jgi:hypothetical protein
MLALDEAPVVAASGGTAPGQQVIGGFVARRFGTYRFQFEVVAATRN